MIYLKPSVSAIYCVSFILQSMVLDALSFDMINRRTVIGGLLSSSSILTTTILPEEANGSTMPVQQQQAGIQGIGGVTTRVEGIGGGFDLNTSMVSKGVDVIYPSSMEGRWNCRRIVTSIEGDSGQAEIAWRNLGGCGRTMLNSIESFDVNFILPSISSTKANIQNEYNVGGEAFKGVILDRGAEIQTRSKEQQYKALWEVDSPDILTYDNGSTAVEVAVVQRKVELPSENGFGFDELYRITSSAGGIFGDNKVQRAVRLKRRYRRALDENGNRTVEGLEIMKTYRVLDGIAGVEIPTSTTKSQLKLRRT